MGNYPTKDEVLWRQFQAGNVDAFTQIVDKYIDTLYDYGKRFSIDSELIRDCIQDIFCTLWDRRTHLSTVTSIRFYLMKALRQKIIRELPKWDRELSLDSIAIKEDFALAIEIEHNTDYTQQLRQKLMRYMNTISPRQKELLYLRFFMDFDLDKIAQLMQLNRQSVYNLQRGALLAMRRVVDYESIVTLMNSIIFFTFF